MLPARTALEAAAAASWPAAVVERRDGWLLRATPGVTGRRLNSALPVDAAPSIALVQHWYEHHRLPPRVQVTPAEDYENLDAELDSRGWSKESETVVLTRPGSDPLTIRGQTPRHEGVRPVDNAGQGEVERVAPGEWGAAWRKLGDASRTVEPAATEVLGRIKAPTLPLVARRGGDLAGVALAVLQPQASIVFSVAVAPEHRRRGVATALMNAWAEQAGDRTLFLQVLATNEAGLAFYEALGFRPSHRYHYRTR